MNKDELEGKAEWSTKGRLMRPRAGRRTQNAIGHARRKVGEAIEDIGNAIKK